jgi:hypothetical protein
MALTRLNGKRLWLYNWPVAALFETTPGLWERLANASKWWCSRGNLKMGLDQMTKDQAMGNGNEESFAEL